MRISIFFVLLILFTNVSIGQNYLNQAKLDLAELSISFSKIKNKSLVFVKKRDSLKHLINSSYDSIHLNNFKIQLDSIYVLQKKLDSIYEKSTIFKEYYISKSVNTDSLNAFFPHKHKFLEHAQNNAADKKNKVYYYFGENQILEESKLFNKENENKIFLDVLSSESESYLGDFIIPQKNQKIIGTKEKNNEPVKKKFFYFQKIKIDLVEGSMTDIKLYANDAQGNILIFENRVPVSLLTFVRSGHTHKLRFALIESTNINRAQSFSTYEDYEISLTDAFLYIPNPGQNYVPDDLILEFPTLKNDISENETQPINYKVIQDTSLQNVLELRTYTDFLALFGESPNGIVQLEANAIFFISPFNLGNSNVYLFKKAVPYVNFSRLDEDNRYVALTNGNDSIKNSLDLIEKAYLNMGIKLDLLSFKFRKEFPFNVNFYLPFSYRIADVKIESLNLENNFKAFGYGAGIRLEFKKFNNFGFNFSAEISRNQTKNFNNIENFNNTDDFWVSKNEAEVYFFPSKIKNQSIFLRFRTFNNSNKNNNEAFFQLQFGYKFSLGINKIKK